MTTIAIKDIPAIEELSEDKARTIVGGMINHRDVGDSVPLVGDPTGGMGYTGILIHYTLTVIE